MCMFFFPFLGLERGRAGSSARSICCQLYDADDYAVVAPSSNLVDFRRNPYVRVKKERKESKPSDSNTKREKRKRNQISEQKIAQQKAIRGPIIRKDKQFYSYLVCIGLVEVKGGIKREKEIKTTNRNLRPTRRKSTKNISCLQVN